MSTQKKFTIALAGNPNVGKSTIFNALTNLHQHTGNWVGKTVACATGQFSYQEIICHVVDLPGIYSLRTNSEEEEIAREYICSGEADLLLLVCDATCIERGLHLLKQIAALKESALYSTILCVNLCDEAAKKGIELDFQILSYELKIPVIPCTARNKRGLDELKKEIHSLYSMKCDISPETDVTQETDVVQEVDVAQEADVVQEADVPQVADILCECCPCGPCHQCTFCSQNKTARKVPAAVPDFSPKQLAAQAVSYTNPDYRNKQERIDRIITGKFTGSLIMIVLLMGVFWLTITGSNYPSAFLWDLFYTLETWLAEWLTSVGAHPLFIDASVHGVYRVVAWIISVMLPPMAIFFPLFTVLEDLGYLPRVAFNMDCAFKKCKACGKQCLTMAMGLGCNAAGVVGCRIIDSPRERLIAILTNSLVPCNGRFPTLIMLITLFFMGSRNSAHPFLTSFTTAGILTGFILLGVFATLFSSWLLSKTVLKGIPSSFTLELPPFRRPQFGKVVIRSIFDRTLFVLGRAVAVAAPAGLIIWFLANINIADQSILWHLSGFLDPFGRFLGMDGIILVGFILGFPANEIVVPIILMAYLQTGRLVDMSDSSTLLTLFTAQGWTIKTAFCMAIFSLFHWPCSTTCLTIKKETGSMKWTIVAFLLPTLLGIILCAAVNFIF